MSPNLIAPLFGGAVTVALATVVLETPRPLGDATGAGTSTPVCRVEAPSLVDAGRYLVSVAGCNDCHTPGYMEKGRLVPEELWLTGVPLGWRGPWGTTYATNLRLFVQDTPEDVWMSICADRSTRPPMPWDNLRFMSEYDRRAIYAYIRHLGPAGEPMPAYCDPGVEPETPCFLLDPGEVAMRPVYAPAPPAGLVPAATSESFHVLGAAARVRVPSAETRDAFSVVELSLPAGGSTAAQVLWRFDLVLELEAGALEVRLGNERHTAGAGDRVVVPRGTPWACRVDGPDPARLVVSTTPGGYDDFLRELALSVAPDDAAAEAELRSAHGVELVVQ